MSQRNPLMEQALRSGNPGCSLPAMGGAQPRQPQQSQQLAGISLSSRVIQPAMAGLSHNPGVENVEMGDTVMPNDSWYEQIRSPSNPTQFEIFHHVVPKGKGLIILDFNFEVYRFSGVGAFASQPVAEKSLNGIMGFMFLINNSVPGQVDVLIEPRPSNFERQQYRPPATELVAPNQRVASDFLRTAAAQYGSASGYGTSILPQRLGPFGAPKAPKGFVALEDMHVQMIGIIYRQMPIPLQGVRATFSGYTGSVTMIRKLIEDLKPAL